VSLEYIRNYYNVPAYRGMPVKENHGKRGVIKSAHGSHLVVVLDGEVIRKFYHPGDLEYLIREYKKGSEK